MCEASTRSRWLACETLWWDEEEGQWMVGD
ncbi:hypothetical protein ALC53_00417 [Atta colombica]|uniref:Uncharacterized protein n=1 Tax=Atta colombica TaxID=520822 RepID=A0A195BW70_9HYME|nr:hypothetical protein ALC53_00417 [Atta colombica]